MDYVNIFPTTLGAKVLDYIPDEYISKSKEYILNSSLISLKEKTPNDYITKDERLLENPVFKTLKKHILNYSKKYVNHIGIPVEDLQVSNSWAVVINPNNVLNNFHYHRNSLISGCFYLTYGGGIDFKSSFYEDLYYFTSPVNPQQSLKHHYTLDIKEKLLILFPSNLAHAISFNNINNRIAIVFNIIPKGEFGVSNAKLF